MNILRQPKIERFNQDVLSKYQIYNSIFMTLPFDKVNNTGVLLPLFKEICDKGFAEHLNPTQIVERFFTQYQDDLSESDKNTLLFRFIQYICLLYTSPSPRDGATSRMPSSA